MIEMRSFINKIFLLRQVPVFRKLNWIELHLIANRATFVSYPKGSIIYQRGDPPDAFYCVISGRLLARNILPNKQSQSIEYLYRGMHFGIVSLLTGEPHSLTFEALNDSLLLKIPHHDFKEILERIPRLGVEFTYSLSRRSKKQEQNHKVIFESTIISVYSSQRGVGSSCYASHLAFQLKKETGKKILFIDMLKDDRSISGKLPGRFSPQWHVHPVCFKALVDRRCDIASEIIKNEHGVDLLYVSLDFNDQHFIENVSHFVSGLANDYHYIVLDLPNAMDDFVFTFLVQSDETHLIVREDPQDLQLLAGLLQRLKTFFKEGNIKEKVKILINESLTLKSLSYEKLYQIVNYDVYAKLPHIHDDEIEQSLDSSALRLSFPPQQHSFTKIVRKVAREIGGVRVGLVLGGGAAFGFAHIGALEVFEKENIPIDAIAGSSIGAIIASFWALGKKSNEMMQWAQDFQDRLKCLSLLDVIFPRSGLIAGWRIERWLRKKIGNAIFYETDIPLKIVTYDIIRREEIVLDQGDIVSAIRKSISIPGVIRPVAHQGKVFIDGGIVNPLPTNTLTSLGVRKIIAINILKSPQDIQEARDCFQQSQTAQKNDPAPRLFQSIKGLWDRMRQKTISPNIFDILVQSFLAVDYLLAEQGAQHADVLIHPDLKGFEWYELYRAQEIMEQGRQAAYQALPEIRRMLQDEN